MNEFITYCKEKKIFVAFGLMLLYVLPLAFYNIPFIDDLGRQSGGYGSWNTDGRFFTNILMKILAINDGFIADFSPLPLFLGLIVLVISAYYFAFRYKIKYSLAVFCLALSFLISPFFLENISFKYDALGMLSSVALAIFASTLAVKDKLDKRKLAFIFLLIFAILGFYQASINIFLVLFCFGLYLSLNEKNEKELFKRAVYIFSILLFALILYKIIASFFVSGSYALAHSQSISFNFEALLTIFTNLKIYLSKAFEVYNHRIYGRLSLAFFLLSFILLFKKANKKQKILLPFLYILTLLSIAGILVVLKIPVFSARTFVGLIGSYAIIVFTLVSASSKKFTYLAIFFISMHFIQAYSYYNSLNRQYENDKYLFALMSFDVEQSQKVVDEIQIIGQEKKKIPAAKAFKVLDFIIPFYSGGSNWQKTTLFERNFINSSVVSSELDENFLKDCNNVLYYHQIYSVYYQDGKMIFDFDRICKLENF